VSIIKFRRARLLQEARFANIAVDDIARALANTAGMKAFMYDAGLTKGYLNKAEVLLELAIKYAQERRLSDW
jgi:hypothetical protein